MMLFRNYYSNILADKLYFCFVCEKPSNLDWNTFIFPKTKCLDPAEERDNIKLAKEEKITTDEFKERKIWINQ